MATTTSLQLAPATLIDHDYMASRRAPLASVPNAVNSPFRQGNFGKRTRAEAGDTKELIQEQPPTKKLLLDNTENIDPIRRRTAVDDGFFSKRPSSTQPTALERKLAASRERKPVHERNERAIKVNGDSLESVRQWQRHYRRQFPQFVFYFDSTPDDVRSKLVRQIMSLGAREEKFFSASVSHVVTTRHIPPELATTAVNQDQSQPVQSIAPSALVQGQQKINSMFDNTLQRRAQQHAMPANDPDVRRVTTQTPDVLVRARELNIKLWALEKLQRVLKTMLEANTGEHGPTPDIQPQILQLNDKPLLKQAKAADLEQLLRNEKVNGPADRDMTVAAQDMVAFKGCYLYIHDMDEKTRPTMVRDYPKPTSRDQGKWPQFHMSGIGRCPFLEDPSQTKEAQEQERKQARELRRATTTTMQPLAETQANLRRSPRKLNVAKDDLAKPLDPPKLIPTKRTTSNEETQPLFGSTHVNGRGLPRMVGGMPVASGMQHSNVTSAIRSQVISSAAISSTAPGMTRRTGDSKEISALKRKVLERTTSVGSQHPSSYMNDVRAAINEDTGPPPRAAKRRAQENILGVVLEGDEDEAKHKKRAAKRSKVDKDPKPGYCENCRDKFDDFDEHINSRKHQKFARTAENWKDLDDLLKKLKRAHKEHF